MLKRKKLGDETWLVESETMKFDARFMLVKSMHQEITRRYSDFRHRSETAASASAP